MSSEKLKVFATIPQQKFLKSRAKEKRFIAGRGSGKTDCFGKAIGLMWREMPRAKGAVLGNSYVSIDSKLIPELRTALKSMGIFEKTKANPYGHYVIGIQPPADWPTPYKQPGKLGYKYCMTFINGFTIQFVSADNPDTHRGFNFDFMLVDESATVPEDFIYKIIKKAVRGDDFKRYAKSRFYKCHYEFSSASWTPEGQHIYKVEESYKAEFEERSKWSQQELKKTPPKFLYVESTCLDNPVTGQSYWEDQKAVDDPLVFDVEVANMRLESIPDGYYHAFKTKVHTYSFAYRYEHDEKTGIVMSMPNDYRSDLPLDNTLDFNKSICWSVVIQEVKNESRIINSNFVKPHPSNESTNLVIENANWFIDTYKNHPEKVVYLYGDPNGASGNVQLTQKDESPFYTWKKIVEAAGWTVIKKWKTVYPRHKRRASLMNAILGETISTLPKVRANQHTNKVLIITLQTTKADDKYRKVKKLEKSQPLAKREYAPDGTDALDYYYYEKYNHLLPDSELQSNQLYIYRKS